MKQQRWIWGALAGVLVVGAWLVLDEEGAQSSPDVPGVTASRERTVDAGVPAVPAVAPPSSTPEEAEPLRVTFDDVPATQLAAPIALEIDHPDGAPAAHALVAFARGGRMLGRGVADRGGMLDLTPLGIRPPFRAWITGVTYAVHVHRVVDADDLRVVLPSGGDISGIVTIDGAPPAAPVPIGLQLHYRRIPTLSNGVRVALESSMLSVVPSSVKFASPTVDGRFRISGCPPEGAGLLTYPAAYTTGKGAGDRRIVAPASDVVLELFSRPSVKVRMVDENGRPLPGAEAHARIGSWSIGVATADADGMVSFHLKSDAASGHALSVDAELGTRRGVFAGDVAVDDVVEIELRPRRFLVVEVVDEEGRPVRDAVVRVLDTNVREQQAIIFSALGVTSPARVTESDPTGKQGRTSIGPMLAASAELEVSAPGHGVATLVVPPKFDEPVRVTLPPLTSLDVTVVGEDGAHVTSPVVHLDASVSVYADNKPRGHVRYVDFGASVASVIRPGEGVMFKGSDAVRALGLAHDVPLELSVKTSFGALLWGPETFTLARGEQREVEAVILGFERDVQVQVVDEQGAPVPRVSLSVFDEVGARSHSGRTDAEGRLMLHAVRHDRVDMLLSADTIVDQRLPVNVTSSPLVLMVDRGRTLDVAVVDEDGRVVNGARVTARGTGGVGEAKAGGAQARSPYRLEHLAAGLVEIRVSVTGKVWTFMDDTSKSNVELRIERVSPLEVTWVPQGERKLQVRLVDPVSGDHRLRRKLTHDECRAGSVLLHAVSMERHRVMLHPKGKRKPVVVDLTDLAESQARVTIE